MLKVTQRIVNVIRHTVGYMTNAGRLSRSTAVKMARKGKLEGITAKRGDHWYIASRPSSEFNLYDLPLLVE